MKHHAFPFNNSRPSGRSLRHPWLAALPAALVALTGLGCYRATGIQRSDVVAEEIPSQGGDRTRGLKAEAAPGDFYLGNDILELAIDGTPFGQGGAVAGAVSGGSIIDASKVELDNSFRRVSMPMDMLERLTPVLNQDPSISLVFDRFEAVNGSDAVSRVNMKGFVHDPGHKLVGAAWDAQGRVQGLEVFHSISLGKQDHFFTLETTVENKSGLTLPVKNIGDLLFQQTGGFRFNVPAAETMAGAALGTWGVEIPGNPFGDPAQAVKASMVAFMGVEPSGDIEDIHSSLGIMPLDSEWLAVTSDRQQALNPIRPVGPQRLIAGSLPQANLASGAKLVHSRRLYVVGGSSTSGYLPNQATGVFNQMEGDRFALKSQDYGVLIFQPSGTAVRQGPWPAEFRIERKVDSAWKLYRVEWMEPYANQPVGGSTTGLPQVFVNLPVGTYRMAVQNGQATANHALLESMVNSASTDNPDVPTAIAIESKKFFASNPGRDYLCPERDSVLGASGAPVAYRANAHYFLSRRMDGTVESMQPLRIMIFGRGTTPDPESKRLRSLGSAYSPVLRDALAISANYGVFGFQGGNQIFASALPSRGSAAYWLGQGDYQAIAMRGPLAPLETRLITAFDGQSQMSHTFTFTGASLPTGWTTLDLPGPSLATTGGILPMEKLSSALAEGVEVVALTEADRLTDGVGLATKFRREFTATVAETDRTPLGSAPFGINARTADLSANPQGFGAVTALFTSTPRTERAGGARNSKGWTLSDFLTQAEGQFAVVHRPRGPQGLFQVPHVAGASQGFDPAVPLGQGANAWWSASGPLAGGKTHGAFDALELVRAEYSDASGQPLSLLDAANANAWFAEFKAVRSDWFALLKQQMPTAFTKALGLSAARFSLDTPVGLARTYLKAADFTQDNLTPILTALQSGAAVASTGPMLDVAITPGGATTSYGPGALVPGPATSWTLSVKLYAATWVPVEEVRVVVNGVATTIPFNATYFTQDATDPRLWTLSDAASKVVTIPAGKDAWVVVEAGVPLSQTGAYRPGTDWSRLMKGIYPIAVTNPIFVKAFAAGTSYTPPGL